MVVRVVAVEVRLPPHVLAAHAHEVDRPASQRRRPSRRTTAGVPVAVEYVRLTAMAQRISPHVRLEPDMPLSLGPLAITDQ